MEDPSSPEFVAGCIVIYLDLVKYFFSATDGDGVTKPFEVEQRQKRRQTDIRLLRYLKSNHFYQRFKSNLQSRSCRGTSEHADK